MAAVTRSTLRVRDVMTREPICVDGSVTIRELARLFDEHEISGAPVVDSGGRLTGIVSKTDLVRRCLQGKPGFPPSFLFEMLSEEAGEETELAPEEQVTVEEFMTPDPLTASQDEPVAALARRMAEARVHRVVVVDRERIPIGMVTSLDLLKVFPE
jgi:CBS domain-containing protein